jgi:hypothetical protein
MATLVIDKFSFTNFEINTFTFLTLNIELFIYYLGCFNNICCSIVGDKLVVND